VESPFSETWIESPDGQSLCALINGNQGLLVYHSENANSSFSSRNPTYIGQANAMIEYQLNNGQLDTYPAAWALPVSKIREALNYFERERQRPPFIVWHED
jgi:hypothetical protein